VHYITISGGTSYRANSGSVLNFAQIVGASYGIVGGMIMDATITCPKCGHQLQRQMPTDARQFFYDCKGCGERLKPREGDCCVFCSYGTVLCPPMQTGGC
jgi:hypothetical protein